MASRDATGPIDSDPVGLLPTAGGAACLLAVRAQPGARRSGLVGVWDGQLKIAVRARAHDGKANDELVRVTAELFGLRPSAVELVRGHSSRTKTLRLALAPAAARRRLAKLLS